MGWMAIVMFRNTSKVEFLLGRLFVDAGKLWLMNNYSDGVRLV